MQRVFVAVVLAACGTSPDTPRRLSFERWSPPQPTSYDVLLAARGDIVVMARRLSRDAGATWEPLDPRLGMPTRVALTSTTLATYANGLVRYDLATGEVTAVAGAPPFTTDRSWRVDPATGRFIVIEPIENAIAVETPAGWTIGRLPQPTPTETRPYVKDVESNGSTLLAISAWGVHRSRDGGASWQLVADDVRDAGRDVLVLADGRFAIAGGAVTYVFGATGEPAGTRGRLVGEDVAATVCEDGAIVAGNQVTHDLGATWQTLLDDTVLPIAVHRASCGGGGRYWALAISDAWGYRLVRFDALGGPGVVAGNWDVEPDQRWASSGPPIVRTADGTFLAAGLALAPGATGWTLREIPTRTWASGNTLFGVAKQELFTSYDGGMTWLAAAANGLGATDPEAFAVSPDGALHVSQFTGGREGMLDVWRSTVWRSLDLGTTWSVAYEAVATRADGESPVGEIHRFVGVRADGAWIATDAVSKDGGVTWQKTGVIGDRGLAHLTPRGSLVTGGPDEDLWRVYSDSGLGELIVTWSIEVEGEAIPAAQLRTVAFDEEGYAYTARGTPNVQIWRSDKPVDRAL